MKKIKKILVCVDFSKYSLMTLTYALEFARGTEAKILVLNVINQKDIHAVETATEIHPLEQGIQAYTKELVQKRYRDLRQLIKDHFCEENSGMALRVEIGIPYEAILETSEKEGVDLIIMANKGRSNLSRVFFGSAAEKVFRHSKVPVVSVRDREAFTRAKS